MTVRVCIFCPLKKLEVMTNPLSISISSAQAVVLKYLFWWKYIEFLGEIADPDLEQEIDNMRILTYQVVRKTQRLLKSRKKGPRAHVMKLQMAKDGEYMSFNKDGLKSTNYV